MTIDNLGMIPPVDPSTGKPVVPTGETIKRVDDDKDLAETNVDRELEIEKENRDPHGLLHNTDNRNIDTAATAKEKGEATGPEEDDPDLEEIHPFLEELEEEIDPEILAANIQGLGDGDTALRDGMIDQGGLPQTENQENLTGTIDSDFPHKLPDKDLGL